MAILALTGRCYHETDSKVMFKNVAADKVISFICQRGEIPLSSQLISGTKLRQINIVTMTIIMAKGC